MNILRNANCPISLFFHLFHATKVAINPIRAKDFARKKHGRRGKTRKEAEIHGKVSYEYEKAALKFGGIAENAFLCNRIQATPFFLEWIWPSSGGFFYDYGTKSYILH
jgi:hypothetical protein